MQINKESRLSVNAVEWLHSYLNNRTQLVKIAAKNNYHKKSFEEVFLRVSTGSVAIYPLH